MVVDIWNRVFDACKRKLSFVDILCADDILYNRYQTARTRSGTSSRGDSGTSGNFGTAFLPFRLRIPVPYVALAPNQECVNDTDRLLFVTGHVTILLVGYQLEHTDVIQPDWVPRTLLRAGVPFAEIWDVLHQLHDSHVRRVVFLRDVYRSLMLITFPLDC